MCVKGLFQVSGVSFYLGIYFYCSFKNSGNLSSCNVTFGRHITIPNDYFELAPRDPHRVIALTAPFHVAYVPR